MKVHRVHSECPDKWIHFKYTLIGLQWEVQVVICCIMTLKTNVTEKEIHLKKKLDTLQESVQNPKQVMIK